MKPITRPFDVTEHLQTEQDIAEYLTLVIEDGDPALLAASLGDIARARGMTHAGQRLRHGPRSALQSPSPQCQPPF